MAYTPGVGRVSMAIAEDPTAAWTLTIKGNTVAVVSDGTAVLGLGDIGPEAAMPVMEGKAMLFKEFAGVDAFPLCIATKDVDEIVAFVKAAAPTFGGINLEDIAAPRCFEIERRLRAELDIPVFHDDQHGTAIVVLAALLNALRIVGKRPEDVTVVVVGAGAAGVACTEIMLAQGVGDVIVVDREGALVAGDPVLTPERAELAARTNRTRRTGGGRPGARRRRRRARPLRARARSRPPACAAMAPGAIVFALANPVPEVHPEEVRDDVAIMATGPLGLPEPDQQRARLPRRVQGRARGARAHDQRGDEARGGAGDRERDPGRRAARRTTSSRACSTAASPRPSPRASPNAAVATGVARRKRGRRGRRARAAHAARLSRARLGAADRAQRAARLDLQDRDARCGPARSDAGGTIAE